MGRKKMVRFANNKDAENVIQEGKDLFGSIKGNWGSSYFKNDNPIVLELACGYGEYTIGLAIKNPGKNYVGVDIKGDRIAVGSSQANEKGLNNVAFLRINIHFLLNYFDKGEVSELWITFPDPFKINSNPARRLTHSKFLMLYSQILRNNHKFFIKTDSLELYDFSINVLVDYGVRELNTTCDYYNSDFYDSKNNFKTRFEEVFSGRGNSIKFIECVLKLDNTPNELSS